jgi:hypothetical protein
MHGVGVVDVGAPHPGHVAGADAFEDLMHVAPHANELARPVAVGVFTVGNTVGVHLPIEAQEEGLAPTLGATRPATEEAVVAPTDDGLQREGRVVGA